MAWCTLMCVASLFENGWKCWPISCDKSVIASFFDFSLLDTELSADNKTNSPSGDMLFFFYAF
jgi:hypothetical protein